MSKLTRWLTRGLSVVGHDTRVDGDNHAQFERVDGGCMDAGDFRSSASMGLNPQHPVDFSETLPAFSFVPTPAPEQRAHVSIG